MDREDKKFDKTITLGKKNARLDRPLQNYYKEDAMKKFMLRLVVIGLMAGCAQLPEYARPRFHESADGGVFDRTGFRYRSLTIEDFQAVSLPEDYKEHNHHINAHSCISIRPAEDSQARITQGVYGDKMFFVGSLPEVRFEAVFMPACSWWNPEVSAQRRDYVLQHEQIHFALAELAARRLTREAQEELRDYLAIGDSYRAVQEELSAKVKDLSRDAMEESFAEHTDFDEETSLFYDPRAQRWWLEEVEARLAEE